MIGARAAPPAGPRPARPPLSPEDAGEAARGPTAEPAALLLRPLSYIFAMFMILNGSLHTLGSLYCGRPIAGVYSSPVLLVAAIALIMAVRTPPSDRESR